MDISCSNFATFFCKLYIQEKNTYLQIIDYCYFIVIPFLFYIFLKDYVLYKNIIFLRVCPPNLHCLNRIRYFMQTITLFYYFFVVDICILFVYQVKKAI